jgi:hypothetical protein
MKLPNLLCVGATILATGLFTSGVAMACEESMTYIGGGYTVSIDAEGGYYGCNSQNQCLAIGQYSQQSKGQYIWENQGMKYSMTPLSSKNDRYQLKVINAKNRVLVRQIMKQTN